MEVSLLETNNNEGAVEELDEVLKSTMPRLMAADTTLHNGDPSPRAAIWSHEQPVTLFGAATTKIGWEEIGPTFDWAPWSPRSW